MRPFLAIFSFVRSRNGCNQPPPTLLVHASATLWGHSDMWWARKQLAKALLD